MRNPDLSTLSEVIFIFFLTQVNNLSEVILGASETQPPSLAYIFAVADPACLWTSYFVALCESPFVASSIRSSSAVACTENSILLRACMVVTLHALQLMSRLSLR
jgi:hypothetical protein